MTSTSHSDGRHACETLCVYDLDAHCTPTSEGPLITARQERGSEHVGDYTHTQTQTYLQRVYRLTPRFGCAHTTLVRSREISASLPPHSLQIVFTAGLCRCSRDAPATVLAAAAHDEDPQVLPRRQSGEELVVLAMQYGLVAPVRTGIGHAMGSTLVLAAALEHLAVFCESLPSRATCGQLPRDHPATTAMKPAQHNLQLLLGHRAHAGGERNQDEATVASARAMCESRCAPAKRQPPPHKQRCASSSSKSGGK